jgi:hypothetical protein
MRSADVDRQAPHGLQVEVGHIGVLSSERQELLSRFSGLHLPACLLAGKDQRSERTKFANPVKGRTE